VFWFIVEGLTPKTAEVMNKTKSLLWPNYGHPYFVDDQIMAHRLMCGSPIKKECGSPLCGFSFNFQADFTVLFPVDFSLIY